MIKPEKLHRGDKIAIVSLSWGGLGDEGLIHKYHIAKERLEKDFGLELETSEEKPSPDYLKYWLRNLGAQGILQNINGILVGKPQDDKFYEEYKEIYLKVLHEFRCEHLPVLYNVNIGHAVPIGILPLGIEYEIDLDQKTIRFLESATC